MNVLFIYINAFSAHGGIQQFNKNFIHALIAGRNSEQSTIQVVSLLDAKKDVPAELPIHFSTANGNRLLFIVHVLIAAFKADKIIFGHINVAVPLIFILKILRKQSILITHGIEVWRPISYLTRKGLACMDMIITVSNFSKTKMMELYGIPSSKIQLLANTLDPAYDTTVISKPQYLMERWGIATSDKIILTVCRLVQGEKNKGYDHVLNSLKSVVVQVPNVKYILAGKYDEFEKKRIDTFIKQHNIKKHVIFTGYIKNEELADVYALCDVFIMPSKKEGFGIVFLEALVKGKTVIAGNKDGSVDALMNGSLGILIDPESETEISNALIKVLLGKADAKYYDSDYLHNKTLETFGMQAFSARVKCILQV